MTPLPTNEACADTLRRAGWGVGEVEAGDGTWVVAAANHLVTLTAAAATRQEAWAQVSARAEAFPPPAQARELLPHPK